MITAVTLTRNIARVTIQLERLLLPLWMQGDSETKWKTSQKKEQLATIVETAANLSLAMRKDRSTLYYWPPTFKDEEFELERMECLHMLDLMEKSPYEGKKTPEGYDRAVVRPGLEHQRHAIVRIVCWPGLVSYQQGGGDLAQEELGNENRNDKRAPPDVQQQQKLLAKQRGDGTLTGHEGFRTKVLCKAVVLLQWGRQRLLTKEAGTSAHLEAKKTGDRKYDKDVEGFVELYDLFEEEVARLQSALGKPSHALHISLWQLLPLGWRLFPVVCHALLLHYTPFTADDIAMSRTFATGWVGVLCLITFCMHPDLCTHAELDDSSIVQGQEWQKVQHERKRGGLLLSWTAALK